MSKLVEIKETNYKVFEVEDDNITLEDVAKGYANGTFLMEGVDTFFLDAQIANTRDELDGSYTEITNLYCKEIWNNEKMETV